MLTKLLENKHVLITGASRGIGAATAKLFAQHGAELYLNARTEQALDDVVSAISDIVPEAICHRLPFDVSDPQAVKSGFQQLFKQSRRLDVLVNNAGIYHEGLLSLVAAPQIKDTFDTNCFSAIYCSQFASRMMLRSGGGSIINLSSIIGTRGAKGNSIYSASKAALLGITQSLSKELAASNIRVNAVAPGIIDTDLTKQLSEENKQALLNNISMGRIGTADEVANSILFLASDMSAYVTGQVLGVDGGMLV